MALVFEQLAVSFLTPVERHAHLPRPREHLRVLDRDFVEHVIGAGRRIAFDDVQRLAVEIPGAIEPGRSLKWITSTTRVFPSQRPRESPIHQSIGPAGCGFPFM